MIAPRHAHRRVRPGGIGVRGVLRSMFTALVLLCAGAAPAEDDRALAQRLIAAYVFVGGGSGVVVSADGVVLTNHHVIDGLDDRSVRFADGTTLPATLLGTDPVGDIAALRIDLTGGLPETWGGAVPHVDLAPAEALRPGIDVIAIGNPFSLGDLDDVPTYTRGVLSLGRVVRGDYTDAVQGDAPVNPGNSGGPLFDLQGRLLGINGQIRSATGFRVNSGIGLAIASPQLAAFLPLLRKAGGGYVRHTTVPKGVEFADGPTGVVVRKPGDASSGLAGDDRLITIAGRAVTSAATARGLCESLPFVIGCTLPVVVERGGSRVAVAMPAARLAVPGRPYHGWTVDEREIDGAKQTRIDHIDDDSPAQAAGLAVGDTFVSVNGKPITSKVSLLRALISQEIGDRLDIALTSRSGAAKSAVVVLGKKE